MPGKRPPGGGLFLLLKPYRGLVILLVILTIAGNALNLAVPKLISGAVDAYARPGFDLTQTVVRFLLVAIFVFLFAYAQSIVQTYAAEKVARDLLARLKQLLVLDWRQRSFARSQLKLTIEDALDGGLPRVYTPELYQQKCSAVFEHVYDNYPARDAGVYAAA